MHAATRSVLLVTAGLIRRLPGFLCLAAPSLFAQPPPVIERPVSVVWGSYRHNEDLVDAGASQWTFVQQHMDAYLLHGAYWNFPTNSIGSPSPDIVGPKLAALVNASQKKVILEHNLGGLYPDVDSAFGASAAGSPSAAAGFFSGIPNIRRITGYGFPVPDISTDYIMEAWKQSVRFHPEWTSKEFFTALAGSWETYDGNQFVPASAYRGTYGWFRQWVEGLAAAYPGIRVTCTNSPVYFNWNEGGVNRRELGGDLNNFHTWLKLERRGDSVTALYSGDGKGWKSLGSASVPLGGAPLAGLFVSSLDSGRLAQARFDNVRVLPCRFADIGKTGTGGDVSVSGSDFTLKCNGNEFLHPGNNTNDAQFLAWRDWDGNGTFTVRLDSLANSNPNRTNPAGEIASAGLMIRESVAPDSRQVSLLANFANQLEFLARPSSGAGLAPVAGSGSPVAGLGVNSTPRWLRLERSGDTITARHSTDGTSWNLLGSVNVAFPSAVMVGLFADSQVRSETATAVFSNCGFLSAPSVSFAGSNVGTAGSGATSSVSGSTYTLKARGSGMAGSADAARLHATGWTGDGSLVARLAWFADDAAPGTPLAAGAQMGITLRADSSAGAPHVSVAFTPQFGLRAVTRASAGSTTAETATYGAGEVSIQQLGSNHRPLLHYFTGNDFMRSLHDAFPATFSANFAGFTTDSPYAGYQKWGGSETHPDALRHREKIILYERWLQQRGREHQFIANSSGGSDFSGFDTATQAGRDAWDLLYKQQSLRSIQLHQLEGGRPDKVLFESWYDGPFTMVPETANGSFTNLVADGIRYLKGTGQALDLSLKTAAEPSFAGTLVYQDTPSSTQVRPWRPAGNASSETFVVRLTNRGSVDAYPVIHAHETGASGWNIAYQLGGADVSTAIRSATGLKITDSATRGAELIAPGASVDLAVQIAAAFPVEPRDLLIRAFWNPQDPTLATRDAVMVSLLPPDDPLAAGLGGYWPFDTDGADHSGSARHLTLSPGAVVSSTPSKRGSAALNLSAGAADAASQQPVATGDAFTLSAWIHLPAGAPSIRAIAANSSGGFNANGFRFFVNSFNTTDGKLILETGNGTQAGIVSSPAGVVLTDRWQHVAAVVNRAAGTATLYRNGLPVASGPVRNDFANSAILRAGSIAGANTLRGSIDDLRLYSRTLTGSEVIQLTAASNTAPVLSTPPSATVAAGTSLGPLAVTVDDAESAAADLVLTATSSDPSLLPESGIALGGSGTDRTLTLTPNAWGGGVATVFLAVSDGVATTTTSFTLTVTNSGYSSQWTGTGTATPLPWTVAGHWALARPAFPGSNCDLDFFSGLTVAPGTHVSHQERADPFTARRITLGGGAPAAALLDIDGSAISLVSNGTGTPAVVLDAAAPLAYRVTAPLAFAGNANVSGNGNGSFEIASSWGGSGGLVKTGTSTLVLTGSNGFSGFTDLFGGTVRAGHAAALGTTAGATRVQGGSNAATLEFAGGITTGEPLRLVMHNLGSGHTQIRNHSGNNTLAGYVSLESGGGRWDISADSGSLAFTGAVSNTVGGSDTWRTLFLKGPAGGSFSGPVTDSASGNRLNLTVTSGVWSLAGTPKTFTGATTVAGGRLVVETGLASNLVIQNGGALAGSGSTTGSLAFHSGARFSLRLSSWSPPPPAFSAAQVLSPATGTWTLEVDATGLPETTGAARVIPVIQQAASPNPDLAKIVLQVGGFTGGGAWSLRNSASALELVYQPDRYQAWTASVAWNGGDSSPLGDPDGDGLRNLLEFALGGDPLLPSATVLPSLSFNGGRLGLSFVRTDDPLIIYQVEASGHPAGPWTAIWTSSGTANAAGPVMVEDEAAAPMPERRFLRLKVSR